MAQAYTRGDSLGIYQTKTATNTANLGGYRSIFDLCSQRFLVTTPLPQIVILAASGYNGTGIGKLAAASTGSLTWTPPDATIGTAVTIAANQVKLIEGATASKWLRVFWDGDYSTATLGGYDDVELMPGVLDQTGSTPGTSTYAGLIVTNQSALSQDITAIKIWIGTLGTQRATGTAQLGGSGSGTITTATANGFADWPAQGWAHIKTSGGSTREIVYYTSRTATSLTVPSGGRGLLGTSAAAGSAIDTVDAIPGVRIGKETADSDNKIQTIASATTAPSGITWNTGITSATGLSVTTLASSVNVGLWLNFDIPSVATGYHGHELPIQFEFTTGGSTYYNTMTLLYHVTNSSEDRYELFAGVDANPTLTGAASTTSATLPFTYALSAPPSGTREHRVTVRKRNEFGLTSLNNRYHSIFVNSAGANVGTGLTAPENTTLVNIGNGELRITSAYPYTADSSPADKWYLYATDDGTDPLLATPIEIANIAEPDGITGRSYLTYDLDGFDWNMTVKIVLRVFRDSDNAESNNTTVITTVVDSSAPAQRLVDQNANGTYGISQSDITTTTTHSASPSVTTVTSIGESLFKIVSTYIFRALARDADNLRLYVDNALAFVNSTISGAGSGNIEVIDANTVYLCVGGTRHAKIDLAAMTISADTFEFIGVIDDCNDTGPVYATNGKLYFAVYNPARSLWEPYMMLDDTGLMTFGFDVIQKDT